MFALIRRRETEQNKNVRKLKQYEEVKHIIKGTPRGDIIIQQEHIKKST